MRSGNTDLSEAAVRENHYRRDPGDAQRQHIKAELELISDSHKRVFLPQVEYKIHCIFFFLIMK